MYLWLEENGLIAGTEEYCEKKKSPETDQSKQDLTKTLYRDCNTEKEENQCMKC